MKNFVVAAVIALGLVEGGVARAEGAEETSPDVAHDAPPPAVKRPWGLETELAQPFIPGVQIFSLKGTRTLWGRDGGLKGDLVVGFYARPNVSHDVVETIDEYLGIAGYRQYVWRGLHAEALTYVGWAGGKRNKIDGRDYTGLAWLAEASAGYRLAFDVGPVDLHVTPQVGYLVGVRTDIGPRETPDRFVTAKLLVGASF